MEDHEEDTAIDTDQKDNSLLALIQVNNKEESKLESTDVSLDALPYIDFQYSDENLKNQVDALVASEMGKSLHTPEEYLERLGLEEPELKLTNSIFLETEWKRVLERKAQTPLDTSRYTVQPPTEEDKTNLEAWQKAVQNAQAQLEHQTNRLVNLELMKRFGGNAWKTYNQHLQFMERSIQNLMKSKKEETDVLNRKRKQEQVSAGEKLSSSE